MLKKILLGVTILLVGLLAFAATRPDTYRVERSSTIPVSADIVYAQLDDMHAWSRWSPWDKLDPAMKKEYGGPPRGVGAYYTWKGNEEVGQGKMTIVRSEPPRAIAYKLEFIEPFESEADTEIQLVPQGEGVKVVWSISGRNDFVSKLFGLFMDMDAMIGADFEKGLVALAEVSRAEAAAAKP